MIDLAKLATQGRAYSGTRPWTPEEFDAVLLLERDGGVGRQLAADYVRNGITTLTALAAAQEANFTPKTMREVEEQTEAALKDNEFAVALETAPEPVEEVETPAEPVEEVPVPEEEEEAPAEDKPKKGKK